jgi:hypothetical protein
MKELLESQIISGFRQSWRAEAGCRATKWRSVGLGVEKAAQLCYKQKKWWYQQGRKSFVDKCTYVAMISLHLGRAETLNSYDDAWCWSRLCGTGCKRLTASTEAGPVVKKKPTKGMRWSRMKRDRGRGRGVRSVRGWRRGKGSERVYTARPFVRSMCVIHANAIELIPFHDAGSPIPSCCCRYTFGSCFVHSARYLSFKCVLGTRAVLTNVGNHANPLPGWQEASDDCLWRESLATPCQTCRSPLPEPPPTST